MSTSDPASKPATAPAAPQPIIIQQRVGGGLVARLMSWLFATLLMGSLLVNLALFSIHSDALSDQSSATETYHSGDRDATTKIALIQISGTIMPPYTERILQNIKHAKDDDHVKGVLLVVDSPGGLVSDSHQIYHRLTELREKKPIVVSMQSLAASGGYYVAMGVGPHGKIYAEPTTWTGSIGVIIPRYNVSELANHWGVKSEPLKTGKFKDALSPFREMSPDEEALWKDIMNQAFDQFLQVIDDNRAPLDRPAVEKLATGQIYTAKDAKQNGLIDEIGYEEDAIAELKKAAGLQTAKVVTYHHLGLFDLLSGSVQAPDTSAAFRAVLDAAVPKAMYFFGWGPALGRTR